MRMIVTIKNGLGVAWNGEMTGAVDVIPFEGNAGKLGAGPILSDGVMLFEDISQVVSVAFVNVFDAKIMNINRARGMAPGVAPIIFSACSSQRNISARTIHILIFLSECS